MSLNSKLIHKLVLFGFTVVEKSSNHFEIYGTFNKRGYSFVLIKDHEASIGTDGSVRSIRFKIAPPTYKFNGLNSHFTYEDDEQRFFRNKQLITKIVIALQKSGVWDILSNQCFFRINDDNKHLDREKVKNLYKSLISKK